MYARDLFTGLGPTFQTANYLAPVGMFNGADPFRAGALFLPTYGGPPPTVGVGQQVWGNFDPVGFRGWQIGVTAAGLIIAQYGTGAAYVSATFNPGARLLRRWCYAEMLYNDGSLSLFVNGALAAVAAGADLVPRIPSAAVVGGYSSSLDGACFGLISGVTYTEAGTSGMDPYETGSEIARTGQVARPVGGVQPQFSWQVPFYNLEGSALWVPATGDVPLTLNGAGQLTSKAVASNAWL
jgi:hypothetical protein